MWFIKAYPKTEWLFFIAILIKQFKVFNIVYIGYATIGRGQFFLIKSFFLRDLPLFPYNRLVPTPYQYNLRYNH